MVRIREFATRIGVVLPICSVLALGVVLLDIAGDPFSQRSSIDLFRSIWITFAAGVPWFYLVDDKAQRSWRGWIPAPLAAISSAVAFCVVSDLQHGRLWSSTLSAVP